MVADTPAEPASASEARDQLSVAASVTTAAPPHGCLRGLAKYRRSFTPPVFKKGHLVEQTLLHICSRCMNSWRMPSEAGRDATIWRGKT
jgi:hypothetical protein